MDVTEQSASVAERALAKAAWHIVPLFFLCYIAAFLDRVNVGFAKLQMAGDLKIGDAVYGAGAGIFFIGYFLFEVPSNLILARIGARVWIARIMITWGIVSAALMFTDAIHWGPVAHALGCGDNELTFYLLRFLLGIAEAGFFPGVILYLTYWFPARWRARTVALFMTAIGVANVVGSPVSGAILQYLDGAQGLRGWQWLFLLEGIPSLVVGFFVLALLPKGPASARWLKEAERDAILSAVAADEAGRPSAGTGASSLAPSPTSGCGRCASFISAVISAFTRSHYGCRRSSKRSASRVPTT